MKEKEFKERLKKIEEQNSTPVEFVHLHNHSHFSLYDGMQRMGVMALRAKELGFKGIALTDHGKVGGFPSFRKACRDAGIKPIYGCLMEGQEIITTSGYENIEKIKIGDFVLTHKGRFRKVLATSKRMYNGAVYDIFLRGKCPIKISLTEEHPILIFNSFMGEGSWVSPGDIEYGRKNLIGGIKNWKSYVAFPKIDSKNDNTKINVNKYLEKNGYRYDNKLVKKTKKLNKYDSIEKGWSFNSDINEDFSYFLGLYVAKGSCGKRKDGRITGVLNLTFNIDELSDCNFVKNFLYINFKIKSNIIVRKDKNTVEIVFCNIPLAIILKEMCGDGSLNKKVPEEIFYTNERNKKKFIEALLDGDGKTINKKNNKQRTLKVSSKKLAYGFRTLISNLDQFSKVCKVIYKGEISYSVNFSENRKYKSFLSDDDYLYIPIKKIKKRETSCNVYNIQVEEDNSYVGDFCLHNCEFYIVDDVKNKKSKVYHQTILAKNLQGYENINQLSSLSHRQVIKKWFNEFPCLSFEDLVKHKEGLIVASGCNSSKMAQLIVNDQMDLAYDLAKRSKEVWGEDYYFEVMWTGYKPQLKVLMALVEMGKKIKIKVIATNDCLNPDSIVYAENGAKLIKDIRVGDRILTHMGRYRRVEVVEEKKTNKNKLKISLKNGDRYNSTNRLIVTEDHRFYVFCKKENRNVWIKACDLDEDFHLLYLPKEKNDYEKEFIEFDIAKDHESESIVIKIDADWMYLFGLFCGDGCATKTSNMIDFCVNPENNHAQDLLESKFKDYGSRDRGWRNFREKMYRYRMTNRYFSRFFKKHFYDKDRIKIIPNFVFNTNLDMQSAFVCGLIDSDGHILKNKNKDKVSFHNTSLNLVDGLRRLMSFGGVHELIQVAKSDVEKYRFGWKSVEKPQYTWSCNKENMRFLDEFLSRYKKYNLNITELCRKDFFRIIKDDCILVKFKKENHKDNLSVWDIQIGEDHSFCTSFGVVHNCHYTYKREAELQRTKISISRSGPLPKDYDQSGEYYMKSYEDMAKVFKGKGEQYLKNTMEIYEKVDDIEPRKARLPNFEIPTDEDFNKFKQTLWGRSEEEAYLRYQAWRGLEKLGLSNDTAHRERLSEELETIRFTKFDTYFLIVWDYCDAARKRNIKIGAGRGCFLPDNFVKIKDGKKKIQDISLGDRVLSHDNNYHEILGLHQYKIEEEIVEIEMEDGRTISCTLDHKILVEKYGERKWIKSQNLIAEDEIVDLKKRNYGNVMMAKIKEIRRKKYKGTVYDLTVNETHSYNIDGLAVHNSGVGSLVLYCLGVIGLDPMDYDLTMDRFLYAKSDYRAKPDAFFEDITGQDRKDFDLDHQDREEYVVNV